MLNREVRAMARFHFLFPPQIYKKNRYNLLSCVKKLLTWFTRASIAV